MHTTFFIEPVLAGLSLGAFCLSYCFPFLAALITSENREVKKNFWLILNFTLGRLLGYMAFGLVFGYLGEKLQSSYLAYLTNLSLILISIILILYCAGLLRQKQDICLAQKFHNRNALAMGILMGVNICPPFLLSLTYVFSLHNTLQSLLYFLIFFLASSIYFLPMIFLGMLAKMKELRIVARISGIVSGSIFLVYGGYLMISQFLRPH